MVRVDRRTAIELARIYVSSSAHSAALEALSGLPANGWDEETHLLRAEALVGLGRLAEAVEVVGPPVLPDPGNIREFDLWRFLLQLRILHRRGEYRRVVEIGKTYFDAGAGIPSVYLARTAMVVAQSMLAQKCPADAREFYKHVLELYQRLGSREGQVDALLGIANTHLLDCHWDRADALYQEARFRYEELGLTDKALAACINLGVIRVKRGEFLSGRDLLQDALTRATQLGAHRRSMTIRLALAMAEIRGGDPTRARAHLSVVLRAARRDGIERDLGLALEFLGELHLAERCWTLAERALNRALVVASRIAPDGDIVFEVKRRLAEVALGRGDDEAAGEMAHEARRLAQAFGDTYEVATCERVLAELAARAGDRETAGRLIRSAAMLLGRLGETYERGRLVTLREQIEADANPGRMRHEPAGGSASPSRRRSRRPDEAPTVPARNGRLGSPGPLGRPAAAVSEPAVGDFREPTQGTGGSTEETRTVGLGTHSPKMTRSLKLAQAVARLDVPVLLVGEPGVGLEALSRLIHGWSGRPGPYVPFHCAGIDPDALEWELHGRNGRSGLCKIADGGTLFLDSVSALGPESQRRLAAWVRSEADRHEEARVRIVAASRNQTGASDTSGLGEGLRRELEGVWVEIPPLRERPEDIPKLVSDIILESSRRFGRRIPLPGLSLIQQWQGRTWTGNLDELREAVERHVAHNLERLR